jgi:hypothetical protein
VGLAVLRRTCMHGCRGYWSCPRVFSWDHCRGAAVCRTISNNFSTSPCTCYCSAFYKPGGEQVENSHGLRGSRTVGRRSVRISSSFLFADEGARAADIAPPLARPYLRYVSCSLVTTTNDPLASWQVASTAPVIPLQYLPTSRTCLCCSSRK